MRRLAAQRGVAPDEERLLLYDIREVIALRHRLDTAPRLDERRLVRALARLVAWLERRTEPHGWPETAAHNKERGMFPYNEALIMASIKERQAEIQREFERYHLARATRAAQPPRPPRLAGLLQCVRRWRTGEATRPRSAGADREERWVA